nr:hypothetical protein [uncultured Dysosmobacter sp.]
MIELSTLEGKKVRLISKSGRSYEGVVGDYIYPEDNAPEEIEAIIIDKPSRDDGFVYKSPVEFTAPEIKSIEIIE